MSGQDAITGLECTPRYWPEAACRPVRCLAEEAVDRPVHMQEVFATLYRNLDIDVTRTTLPDHNGRPQYLIDQTEPIRELV